MDPRCDGEYCHVVRLGDYDILKKLGEGGSAKVYLAEKRGLGGFRKLHVLKCLKPSLARDPVIRDDFLAEARLSAHMSHPNVVQVHEVFEVKGVPIMVLEYLDGQALSDLRGDLRAALPIGLEVYVLTEALRGLHYVHELESEDGRPLGIVHRDISPQNLFVTYAGDVKLLDFGIAKLAGSSATEYGIIKGKIAYLAPEQLRASEADTVDRRADLFAIGLLLWEAAAGRSMWAGMNEGEVLGRLVEGNLPELEVFPSDCPKGLLPIVERALQPSPAARFATADEMRAALVPILDEIDPRPATAHLEALLGQHYASRRTTSRRKIAETHADSAYERPSGRSSLESDSPGSYTESSHPSTTPHSRPVGLSRNHRTASSRRNGLVLGGLALPLLLLAVAGYLGLSAATRRAHVTESRVSDAPEPLTAPETSASVGRPARESAPCPDPFSISDFEAGRAEACSTAGRRGGDYVSFFDGTGRIEPPSGPLGPAVRLPVPRGTSQWALHVRGEGLTDWGAGVAVTLNEGRPVDLRGYSGVRLWMRSDNRVQTRIEVATQVTLDKTYGGECISEPKIQCDDNYSAQRFVGPYWQEMRIPFATFRQVGWGRVAPWRPDVALEVHVGIPRSENLPDGNPAKPLSFDLWIDDVSFY